MFCPRCGSQTNEGLKFCKSCGLPLAQISTYVATGGTAPLTQPPVAAPPEHLTPRQQLVFTILLFVFIIPVVAVLGEVLGLSGDLAALPAILLPLGILWAVFRYRTQLRRLQYRSQQSMLAQQSMPPAQVPQMQQPSAGAPAYQPSLPPPRTNPLPDPARGSVVEDETRKLPENRR